MRMALLMLLGLVACKRETPETAPVASPSGSAASAADTPAAPASTADAAAAPATEVDLLHAGPANVIVSSNVRNPKDYPAHLVDGREDTAWNSRTGDLVGARIAFVVPGDAQIKAIVISAGFNKSTDKGDLFTMNHRVRKLAVRNANDELLEHVALDVDRREPQRIAFDRPGGGYVLEVEEVVPGTKRAWRELALSELQVLGIPGKDRYAKPRFPNVTVSPVPNPRWPLPGTENASYLGHYEEMLGDFTPDACKAYERAVHDPLTAEAKRQGFNLPKPWCTVTPQAATALAAPLKRVAQVELEAPNFTSLRALLLETDKGVVIPRYSAVCEQIHVGGCDDDMGTVVSHITSAKVVDGTAEIIVARKDEGIEGPTERVEMTFRCPLTPPVTCSVSVRDL